MDTVFVVVIKEKCGVETIPSVFRNFEDAKTFTEVSLLNKGYQPSEMFKIKNEVGDMLQMFYGAEDVCGEIIEREVES